MRNLIPALLLIALTACTTVPMGKPPAPPVDSSSLDSIRTLAANSACAKYDWQDQGVAPLAYTKGMALAYARAICQANLVASKALGDSGHDALAYFSDRLNKSAPILRQLYTLMMGEGMRESSGRYCVGKDGGADNTDGDSTEAGLFQTSWDSHEVNEAANAALMPIWNASTSNCLDDFKQDIECDAENLKNWGDPNSTGYAFQKREKDCPAFAVDYTAAAFRTERNQYAPLNDRSAEIAPACDQMLAQVEQVMKANPSLCKEL